MSKMTRRSFVGSSAATAGALGLGLTTANRVRGANTDLRDALIALLAVPGASGDIQIGHPLGADALKCGFGGVDLAVGNDQRRVCRLHGRDESVFFERLGRRRDAGTEPIRRDRVGVQDESELFLRRGEFLGDALPIRPELVNLNTGADHIGFRNRPRLEAGLGDVERLGGNRDQLVDKGELRVEFKHAGVQFGDSAEHLAPDTLDVGQLRGLLRVRGGHRGAETVPDDDRLRDTDDSVG